jgi:hypothetical protein
MKNKPWKTWKTRKWVFTGVCVLWLATAIRGLLGQPIEESVIDFIYKAGVWLCGFGIGLVISDKVGGMLLKRNGGNGDEL